MRTKHFRGYKTSPNGPEVKPLDTDDVFHLLSNERRRHVILILLDEGSLSKRELGTRVAERENDRPREKLSSKEKQCVRVSLHQNHLCRLDDADVINVDHHTISLGPNVDELAKHLERDSLVKRLLSF